QGRQQSDRNQRHGSLDARVLEPSLREGETRKLERVARNRSRQDAGPDHLLNTPNKVTRRATTSSGTPAGTKGSTAIATTAAAIAIASGARARSRGASRARNAAGGAASSPRTFGFETAWVARAPATVPRFQSTNSASPVAQNAYRLTVGSSRAMAIAVVSSITKCAAARRRRPPTFNSEERRTPYRALRDPSSAAVAAPAHTLPPAPRTPTRANCDAPVNMRTERVHVCSSERPAAVEMAPKEIA